MSLDQSESAVMPGTSHEIMLSHMCMLTVLRTRSKGPSLRSSPLEKSRTITLLL